MIIIIIIIIILSKIPPPSSTSLHTHAPMGVFHKQMAIMWHAPWKQMLTDFP